MAATTALAAAAAVDANDPAFGAVFYCDSWRCLLGYRTALCCHVRESFGATAFPNSSPIKNHAGAKSRRITWLMFQGLFW